MTTINCPLCKIGVLEPIAYFDLGDGPLQLKMSFFIPNRSIGIHICSNDRCCHTEMKAAPGSLTSAKSTLRDLLYASERARKLP